MLMAVKNQMRISLLSIKYSLMREMLNKTTFLSNVFFMILNNASFIIQWVILYSLKENVGGYSFNEVLLLWGIAAGTYGFSRFFFSGAFSISDMVTNGKLDSYLVQPKNVLVSVCTSNVNVSAIGDLIYGYIMLFVFGFSIKNCLLFTLFIVTGGVILVSFSVILSSLSFWITKSDLIADTCNDLTVTFATYPDGIFKGIVKILLYTIIPIGISTYIPIKILSEFNIYLFLIVVLSTILIITLAFIVFNRGLKRYSSSNLMIARM